MEEKAFAVITKDSVRLIAEAAGYNGVADDAAALLGEDVSYRLREAAMKSAAFIKNAKRRRLSPEDFNQALRESDIEPVLGHCSSDAVSFRQVREGDLHFADDPDVNFSNAAFNSYVPKSLGKASIKAQWLAVEGVNKSASSSNCQNAGRPVLCEELRDYYTQITKALVGAHFKIAKWALWDLSVNDSIQPLLPFLINFVVTGMKTVHDVSKRMLLMHAVDALVRNPSLAIGSQPYLDTVTQTVEGCVLSVPPESGEQGVGDHYTLRRLAAQVLARITRRCSRPVNDMHSALVERLGEAIRDPSSPLPAVTGAVMALTCLGCSAVEKGLFPHLSHLLHLLDDLETPGQPPSHPLLTLGAAVRDAVEAVLRERLKSDASRHSPPATNTASSEADCLPTHNILQVYQQVAGLFGDSLSGRLAVVGGEGLVRRGVSAPLISLGESGSGEELLQDLMRQVKREQEQREAGAGPRGAPPDRPPIGFQEVPPLPQSQPTSAALKMKIQRQSHSQPSPLQRHKVWGPSAPPNPVPTPSLLSSAAFPPWGQNMDASHPPAPLSDQPFSHYPYPQPLLHPPPSSSSSQSSESKKAKMMVTLKLPSPDSPTL